MKRIALVTGLLIAALTLSLVLAGEATGPQLELGSKAPDFSLKGTDGQAHAFADLKGAKGSVVVFTCNHCPFAKAYEDRLISLAKEFSGKGINFVAINANDPQVAPDDSFDKMVVRAKEKSLPYPYLLDESQATAKAYGAQVTPHVFVFDSAGLLRYRGRVDDSVKPDEVKTHDLHDALDAIVGGKDVATPSTKAFGCSVKWKKSA